MDLEITTRIDKQPTQHAWMKVTNQDCHLGAN